MAKVKYNLQNKRFIKDIHFLYEILNEMKNLGEVKILLKDLLTPSELKMFKRRWAIACLLDEGYDVRRAANKLKCGTEAVLRVKKILEEGYGGLKLALKRTEKGRVKVEKEPGMGENFADRLPNQPRYQAFKWMFGSGK